MSEFLEKYSSKFPSFYIQLQSFQKKIGDDFISKLKKINNQVEFFSKVSEIKFGFEFHKLGFQLEYEKKYPNKQTPDWTIDYCDSTAICEVYRLGKSKEDQEKSKFETDLINQIEELPYNYFIDIKFIGTTLRPEDYKINEILYELKHWFKEGEKTAGDKLLLKESFLFKIQPQIKDRDYITCRIISIASHIKHKPEKLIQHSYLEQPNEITNKITKYNSLIDKYKLPYFLAVEIDFKSGFDYEDFVEYFLGKKVEFVDFNSPEAKHHLEHLGRTWTELGIFHQYSNLSGLIINDNGKFQLLLNPLKKQIIYRKEFRSLLNQLKQIEN